MKVLGGVSKRRHIVYFLLFLGVPLLLLVMVFYVPLYLALKFSFADYDVLTPPRYVGLKNWAKMFADEVFWISLRNTLAYTGLYVVFTTGASFLIALGLNKRFRYTSTLRTLYFLPMVTSVIAVLLIWKWMYNPSYGIFNTILNLFHLPSVQWLTSPKSALISLVIFGVWSNVSLFTLLFLAGLQNIPQVYYEAAAIDGASRLRQIINITAPLISPTTFFVLVMTSLGGAQVFESIFMLTRGGPGYATYTLVYYIYRNGFYWFRMGYGIVIAWFSFVILFVLTLIQFRLQKWWVYYA